MTRLTEGRFAPAFDTVDHFGEPVSFAALGGRKILLSFYRYASCPLCNLRVNAIIKRHDEWAENGLSVIGVFQSPAEEIRSYVGQQDAPFPIVADPGMGHYRRFGVETSWLGFLRANLRVDWVVRAIAGGYLPGKISGPAHRIPADFLIDQDGRLARCFYGNNAGDHLPLRDIDAFVFGA